MRILRRARNDDRVFVMGVGKLCLWVAGWCQSVHFCKQKILESKVIMKWQNYAPEWDSHSLAIRTL